MAQKVLYIAGAGRSGSLLLNNILGQVEGFFGCGEMYHLYRAPLSQRYCSCGEPLTECPIWQPTLSRTTDDLDQWQKWMLGARDRFARSRYLPSWLLATTRRRFLRGAEDYLRQLGQLYNNIAQQTQARVLIDASKVATYAALLTQAPGLQLYILHLVRDARAVAYSWQRRKRVSTPVGEVEPPVASSVHGAMRWLWHNLAVEACHRRVKMPLMRLRYEDLIACPEKTMSRILSFLEEEGDLSFIQSNSVMMDIQHNVGGNPSRFQRGKVCLRPDNEWEGRMSKLDRLVVTLVNLPLLRRYGYV